MDYGDGIGTGEDLGEGVERAGADVTEDHPESSEGEDGGGTSWSARINDFGHLGLVSVGKGDGVAGDASRREFHEGE